MSNADNMDIEPGWDLEELDPDFPDSGAHPGVMLEGRGRVLEEESIGPFPAEPAPGSPEAAAQAAETIASLRTGSHPQSANAKLADLADELADALEPYVRRAEAALASPSMKEVLPSPELVAGRAALRKAGRS